MGAALGRDVESTLKEKMKVEKMMGSGFFKF